jgi:transglutaminase-like putative cysteine protease
MRVLSVRHLTTYRYAEPVALGEHRMMFRPRASHDLRLIQTRLQITPQPVDLRWLHDAFDNSVAVATFGATTTWLQFDSMVTLEHFESHLPDYALEAAARTYPFEYPWEEWPDLVRAVNRQEPSPEVDRWAGQFLSQVRTQDGTIGTMDLLRAMALGIRQQLRYIRRIERGVQTPAETLRNGSGTCRDFAWLMIDAIRFLGFAARFVSGYIFVPGDAPPVATDLTAGGDPMGTPEGGATHAWLQVYLPGAGWVDFDPTNSIIGNRNLIRVAVGWSPRQVLPLWGTYEGSASACLGMKVAVRVTEELIDANPVV